MIICGECGKRFDEDDIETYEECVGEYWGQPAYETFGICPYCKSDCIEEEKYILIIDKVEEETYTNKDEALKALDELKNNPEYMGCKIVLLDCFDEEVI